MQSLYENTLYAFNPLAIQTLVVALAMLYLGIYALIRGQGSPVAVVFFVITLCMGIWIFAFSWMYASLDYRLAMWWAKVGHVGIAFIPAAVHHFSALMLKNHEKARKRILIVWLASGVFATINNVTDIQFKSLYSYSWGVFPHSGLSSVPFLLYFFGIMGIALRNYLEGFRARGRSHAQTVRARILLIGFGVGSLALFDFVPAYGVELYPFGYIPMFFFCIIAAYSISRYRFKEITPALAAGEIIDTMTDALIVLDPDGVVRLVNQATCGLFGYGERDLIGKRLRDSMHRSSFFAAQLESIIRSGTVLNRDVEYQPEGGTRRRTLSLSTSIVRSPGNEALATVCVVRDITDRDRVERERERLIVQLQEANRKLQALDRLKSDFVSVVSHELRTPLTTIKAFIELIIMRPAMHDQQKAKLMTTVNDETDRLTRLINDLLDLSRIETGTLEWRSVSVAIDKTIEHAAASMRPLLENKGLRLTTEFCAPLPAITGDRDRLIQVVTNILSNAIKFTPTGGAIHIAVRQEADPRPQIAVEISDTGIGIQAQDRESIFEKFYRSAAGLTSSIEGTGLGLSITRQIVEHHGGKIWATSGPGQGSTFTFTLPLPGKVVSAAWEQ